MHEPALAGVRRRLRNLRIPDDSSYVQPRPLYTPKRPHKLPPLILHPLSDASGPERLARSARASLALQGLLPHEGGAAEGELILQMLDGRYCEIRMLFYVGKDVNRWVDQCLEVADRDEELRRAGLRRESFAHLLVTGPPEAVREKLRLWGVTDHAAIFRRAMALHEIFGELPQREALAAGFLRRHHRFADALFEVSMEAADYPVLRAADFSFELYASGEYARLLEQEWAPE